MYKNLTEVHVLFTIVAIFIQVLKMYAWEFTFIQKIDQIRQKEVELLRKNALLNAIGTSVAYHSQSVVGTAQSWLDGPIRMAPSAHIRPS